MNGAQAVVVVGSELDAVCSIGFGDLGDSANTFGCGALIGTRQILTALHVMPYTTSGYHTLPQDSSTTARMTRWRIKEDGSKTTGSGLAADYQQVRILGYRVASPAADIVLADLAADVAHITALPVDTGVPAVNDTLLLAGWGLDGATLGAGSRPNDVKKITGRTVSRVSTATNGRVARVDWSGTNPGPNLYDSGSPVLRDVSGTFKVTGVVTTEGDGTTIDQFLHNATFQIPGFYSAATPSDPPALPSQYITSADVWVFSDNPTADGSAVATLQATASDDFLGPFTYKGIFVGFDVRGVNPSAAALVLTLAAATVASPTIRFRRIRRTVTALANFNTYDGTNAWGTVCAENTTTDVYTTNQFTVVAGAAVAAGTQVRITDAGLLAMVRAARAEDGILRLLMEPTQLDNRIFQVHSLDAVMPGVRPRLELSYSIPYTGARASRAGRLQRVYRP